MLVARWCLRRRWIIWLWFALWSNLGFLVIVDSTDQSVVIQDNNLPCGEQGGANSAGGQSKDDGKLFLREQLVYPVLLKSSNGSKHVRLYRFNAFNTTFQLRLSADTRFLSPHFRVEVLQSIGENSTLHIIDSEDRLKPETMDMDQRDCFYVGHVVGDEESRASMSICHGQLIHSGFWLEKDASRPEYFGPKNSLIVLLLQITQWFN